MPLGLFVPNVVRQVKITSGYDSSMAAEKIKKLFSDYFRLSVIVGNGYGESTA